MYITYIRVGKYILPGCVDRFPEKRKSILSRAGTFYDAKTKYLYVRADKKLYIIAQAHFFIVNQTHVSDKKQNKLIRSLKSTIPQKKGRKRKKNIKA